MSTAIRESLIVFSDVHLGSDLNDSGPSVPRSVAIDTDLTALLAHYRGRTPPADRWRLVIAGDFVDFVGMSIDARESDVLTTEPTAAERAFGLGGAEDHVRLKLKRAAERHPDVFAALGAFVAEGHALTVIQGNHDLELHWPSVQQDFCALLAGTSGTDAKTDELAQRIEFQPWFFHREGLVYIEHGHQFDPFCATPYIFAPLSPIDSRRVLQSLSDTLLRYIVRRTPGMKEYGHENRGLMSYVSWGLMLGARGTVRLLRRFVHAVALLRQVARAYGSEHGARVREQHERGLSAHSKARSFSEDRLRAALALHVEPMGATQRGVLASVMLDRLYVVFALVAALLAVAVLRSHLGGYALYVTLAVFLVWAAAYVVVSRARPSVDPAAVMGSRAGDLVKLFPSSFVVMGHTHVPTTKAVGDGHYINLGSWAEEEPDPGEDASRVYRAARTHLVVHAHDDRHEASFCEWQSGVGPREIRSLVRTLASPS